MALIHADGFGHYASARYDDVYVDGPFGATITVGAYGPGGGAGLRFSGDYRESVERFDIAPSGSVCIMQGDFRIGAAPSSANVLLGPMIGSDQQCSIVMNTDRTLRAYRGDRTGTALGTGDSAYVVPLNTHIHLGVMFTVDNAVGSAVVHVWAAGDTAAQVVINVTGVDTQFGSAGWDGLDFGACNDTTTDWANLVVMDGSGATLNDLLGPIDVLTLFANARVASEVSAWSLSSGTSVAALLDETTPDDDTTYCQASTNTNEVSTAVDTIPYPGRTLLGAQLYASAKLTSGSPTVKALARDGGSSYLGSNVSPGASYAYVQAPYSAMPSGAAFSTAAAFDALQWGLALTSASTTARLTQVAVVVLLDRSVAKHNLLTGYGHTVSGDDNLLAGQSNTVVGAASEAHGLLASVAALRSVLFALTGVSISEVENGVFRVDASKIKLNGPLTLNGSPLALTSLGDVAIGSPLANGDLLTYDLVSGTWINEPLGGVSGLGPLNALTDVVIGSPLVDGDVLTYDTGSALWFNAPPVSSGGDLVLLEQHTASASASLDFTTWYSSSYDTYQIEVLGAIPATTAQHLIVLFSTDGGATYDGGANYDRMEQVINTGNSWSSQGAVAQTTGQLFIDVSNASTGGVSGTFRFVNPASTAVHKPFFGKCMGYQAGTTKWALMETGVVYLSTTAVNAFQFKFSSGNIASGVVRVYGLTK